VAKTSGKKQRDLLWQSRAYKDPSGYKEIKLLYRMMGQLLRVKKSYPDRAARRNREASSRLQLCVVKARIGKSLEAHTKFLSFYLPQKNKDGVLEKPELFGGGEPGGPLAEYEKRMAARHFKFIVSPESQRADTEALVRTLVKRMEKATGKRFHWVAATHTDTAHKHAHLLINGVDRDGGEVSFDRDFISHTVREMARQICTAMIGPRSREETAEARSRQHTALRYTPLDDELRAIERPYAGGSPRFESRADASSDTHYKRLCFLAASGFAEQDETDRGRFYLEAGWKAKLKTLGRYNSFLNARQNLLFTSSANLEQYTGATGPIEGKITRLYRMNDEDSWNHAVVVENKTAGRAWYVPLYYEPRDALLGADVRCSAKENERGQLRPGIDVLKRAGSRNVPR
jgi:hypothetical protein